jgi:hypothetical protein
MLLAGCTAPGGAGSHAGELYVVNTQRTLFYSYGPAQSTGPDFALYHGQRLTMLSYEYGFSHVSVAGTGQAGYVPTEDIIPESASARPSPTALPATSHGHHRRGAEYRPPTPAEQSQVPLPEFPESKPAPGAPPFRY